MAAYTTIDDPEAHFRIKLYAGNGSSDRAITFDTTDTTMQPDLVWLKNRSTGSTNHALMGTGLNTGEYIRSNDTNAETSGADVINSIDSNGFEIGSSGAINNDSGDNYVAWCWKESTTAGFDIVTYTGNNSNRTISHGLGAALDYIIVKNRATTNQWCIYNRPQSAEKFIHFDSNDGESDASTPWQDTEPTSSVFSVGASNLTNGDGNAMIAYCFAPIQGFSKFGSYIGNGNASGTFVYTGFKPAFVMIKCTDSAQDWVIRDNKRDIDNPTQKRLMPNITDAEGSVTADFDFLSNGFKARGTGLNFNGSGNTYIFMAFAEQPFVNSEGVPCNAR